MLGRKLSVKDSDFETKAATLLKDGIAQMTIKNIFHCIHASIELGVIKHMPRIELQLFQIYNEDIKDLLSSKEFVPQKGVRKDLLKFDKSAKQPQQCTIKLNKDGE